MSQATDSLPMEFNHLFVEYRLMKELVLFQKRNLSHVYISPSNQSAFDWFGVMFIHSGFYSGKILRFLFQIDTSYPKCDIPKVIFEPIPHHPLVDKISGQLDTTYLRDKWNSVNHLYEVIAYVKSVFDVDSVEKLTKLAKSSTMENITNEQLAAAISEQMSDFNELSINHKREDCHFIDFNMPSNNDFALERVRQNMIKDNGIDIQQTFQQSHPLQQSQQRSTRQTQQNNAYKPLFSGFSWRKKVSLE